MIWVPQELRKPTSIYQHIDIAEYRVFSVKLLSLFNRNMSS